MAPVNAPLIPLHHFFDNPERANARPSPDGSSIAYVAPRDGVLNVWVEPAGGGEARPVTDDRDRGVRSYMWSRDGSSIIHLQDRGGDENHHVYLVDVHEPGRARDLTPFPGVRAGLIAAPRATPRHIVAGMNLRDRSRFDAYRITLATGRLELVGENPGNVLGWVVDRAGRVRAARAQTEDGDFEILVADAEGGALRVVARYPNEDGGHVYAFTPDGSSLWVGSARGTDRARLVELDLASGTERVVDEDPVADLGGPVISDRTGRLLGAAYRRDRLVMSVHDDEFGSDWERLRSLHPGDPVVTGQDAEERVWVAAYDDDRDPGATYLVERGGGAARLLFR